VASSTYVSLLMHYTPFTISTHIRRSASKPCFVNWVMESGGPLDKLRLAATVSGGRLLFAFGAHSE
jgi:hypothetical protein